MRRQFLTVEETAELLRTTARSVHGLTAKNAIPLRRIDGMRRVLVPADELQTFLANGGELEVLDEGRIVRPKGPAR